MFHKQKHKNEQVMFSVFQGNEARVYEFIVRHFLACVSQDALGQETVVDIDIAQEKFSASGLMIIARNYLDVYPYDKWSAKVWLESLTHSNVTCETSSRTSGPPCSCCLFVIKPLINVVLQVIPVFEQDSQFQPSAIEMVDGQTSPPQLLTEADLISLMEKHGIGNI